MYSFALIDVLSHKNHTILGGCIFVVNSNGLSLYYSKTSFRSLYSVSLINFILPASTKPYISPFASSIPGKLLAFIKFALNSLILFVICMIKICILYFLLLNLNHLMVNLT